MIEPRTDLTFHDIRARSAEAVVDGVIPRQDCDRVRGAGVQALFGPGTNLIDVAGEVLKLLATPWPGWRSPQNDRG